MEPAMTMDVGAVSDLGAALRVVGDAAVDLADLAPGALAGSSTAEATRRATGAVVSALASVGATLADLGDAVRAAAVAVDERDRDTARSIGRAG